MNPPTHDLAGYVRDRNVLLAGGTGMGKSGALQLMCRAFARNPAEAFSLVDPHGSVARPLIEWAANPANGASARALHFFDASDYTFGINPLDCGSDAPTFDECHDCASVLVAIIGNFFDQKSEATPRMTRLIYVAGFVCTYKKLSIVEVLEIFALGAHELRRFLLENFNNCVVRRELEDLIELAERYPARFLELVESTKNRLVRWLASPRLARIFACKSPIRPRRIMDAREILVSDLSAFSIDDGAFIATALTTQYFAEAKRRRPDACARHRLIGDEFEAMVVDYTAKLVSQTRKYGLSLVCAIQYLSQLLAKGQFVADALLTNCHLQIVLGGLASADARAFAELHSTGHINFAEWISGTERPVVVGHDKALVRSTSRAQHHAEHHTRARTTSRSRGEATASMVATSTASGEFTGSADSAGLVLTPPLNLTGPNAPNASMLPYALSQSTGESRSRGSSLQSATSKGTSHVRIDVRGEADTVGYGVSRGTSVSEGLSEVFVPRLEWLPSALYTPEAQLLRAQGLLMNLPPRSCIVKVTGEAPFLTRTADLTPAFRCAHFKREMLPRFLKTTSERSPYLVPTAVADGMLAARSVAAMPPDPDLTAPEPLPPSILDDPIGFARSFWDRRMIPPSDATERRKPGRKPASERPGAERFSVIDGDAPQPEGDK